MTHTPDLSTPCKFARSGRAHDPSARIDREGGDRGAGLISGFAVITRGEALGHGFWVDQEFLAQVNQQMIDAGDAGIKSRFTHHGLSADGLGSYLGRVKNPRLDGDILRADLHFAKSAHETPDGDLASYTMDLVAEDPDALGASIVFQRDREAIEQFTNEHRQDGHGFVSPDSANTKNLPHVRLAALKAADIVDEPAANPAGMFQRSAEVADDGEALLAYALGLSQERPTLAALSIDPDRASGFVSRFMERHGLELRSREQAPAHSQETPPMSDTPQTPAQPQAPTREQYAAELNQYVEQFGAENGVQWFRDGLSFEAATAKHLNQLGARIEELETQLGERDTQIEQLETELAAAKGQQRRKRPSFVASDADDEDFDDDDGDALSAAGEKLWKKSEQLRTEFDGNKAGFLADYRRNPNDYS